DHPNRWPEAGRRATGHRRDEESQTTLLTPQLRPDPRHHLRPRRELRDLLRQPPPRTPAARVRERDGQRWRVPHGLEDREMIGPQAGGTHTPWAVVSVSAPRSAWDR